MNGNDEKKCSEVFNLQTHVYCNNKTKQLKKLKSMNVSTGQTTHKLLTSSAMHSAQANFSQFDSNSYLQLSFSVMAVLAAAHGAD